jgi:hypothetical protein
MLCPMSSASVEVAVVSEGELSAVCEPWWCRPRCSKFLWCSTPFRERPASVKTREVAVSQKSYIETSLRQKASLVFRSSSLHRSVVHFAVFDSSRRNLPLQLPIQRTPKRPNRKPRGATRQQVITT